MFFYTPLLFFSLWLEIMAGNRKERD